jgi:hypothetical protein
MDGVRGAEYCTFAASAVAKLASGKVRVCGYDRSKLGKYNLGFLISDHFTHTRIPAYPHM